MLRYIFIQILETHPIFRSKFFQNHDQNQHQNIEDNYRMEKIVNDMLPHVFPVNENPFSLQKEKKDLQFLDYCGIALNQLVKDKISSGIIIIVPGSRNQILVVKNKENGLIDLPNALIIPSDQSLVHSASERFFELTGFRVIPTKYNSFTKRIGNCYYYVIFVSGPIKKVKNVKNVDMIQINDIPGTKNISNGLMEFYKSHRTSCKL